MLIWFGRYDQTSIVDIGKKKVKSQTSIDLILGSDPNSRCYIVTVFVMKEDNCSAPGFPPRWAWVREVPISLQLDVKQEWLHFEQPSENS